MTSKPPRPPLAPTKEDRLAKALRENLARRKALVRSRKAHAEGQVPAPEDAARDPANPEDDDGPL
jgi:hypothetical protein